MPELTLVQKTAVLELLGRESETDALRAARAINQATGTGTDWHAYSAYLDQLHTKKLVRVVRINADGMTVYSLAR